MTSSPPISFLERTFFAIIAGALLLVAPAAQADPLNCNLADYKAAPGLAAAVTDNSLVVTWDGDNNAQLRLRFGIEGGTPTIQELAVHPKGGSWRVLATSLRPEFRVVSGLRRVTQQQLRPDSIQALGGKVSPEVLNLYRKEGEWVDQAVREGQITREVVERIKWEAFWDSPLYVEGSGVRPPSHATSIPPVHGIFDRQAGARGVPCVSGGEARGVWHGGKRQSRRARIAIDA